MDSTINTQEQNMTVAVTLATLKFLNYCLYTLIVPFMPLILKQYGVSTVWVGYIFAAYPISTIVCTPLIALGSNTIGRKRSLLIGSIAQWIGCMLFLLLKYIQKAE